MSSTVSKIQNRSGNGQDRDLPKSVIKDIELGKAHATQTPIIKVPEFCPGLNEEKSTPLDDQVGGEHYKFLKVQPFVSNFKNWGPEVAMGEVINRCYSFVASYRAGDADFEELEKIVHEVKMLSQLVQEEANERCQDSESSSCAGPSCDRKSS